MKKLSITIFAALLCFSLVACGNNKKTTVLNNNTDNSTNYSEIEQTNTSDEIETSEEAEEVKKLPNTYKVPLKNIYYFAKNTPSKLRIRRG